MIDELPGEAQSVTSGILLQADDSLPRRTRGGGAAILIALTLLWGTTFAITKDARREMSAGTLIFLRFIIAAVLLTPFLRRGKALWLAGVELGLWLWAGFLTQTIGLGDSPAGRSAFITSLNVIFVPMLAALGGRRIGLLVWIAAALALGGAALMCLDGSRPNSSDLWALACAVLFAIFIVRMETAAARFKALPLTAVQLLTVTALSLPWFARDAIAGTQHIPWGPVIYLGIFCTAVTTWLQTVGQRTVPAPQASIIFMLEPVFAAAFAFLVFQERMGWRGVAGSGVIMGATVMSQVPMFVRGRANR